MSPLAVVAAFGAVIAYLVGDGIHQNRTNPAQPRPISDRIQRRRAVNK